ncbi:ABC-type polysaccharide/polyol phosphate transport system ATPase subunit [Roseimicrobium gellanilyticum]|uniref:ABC-type polysaccharide/polyol phosphate transport system ATPase subunit n=1 Tax=Roseimicrobium gellanilyticum TaxID=748857 RepID=A0A366HRY6_9BACT|nr:ABC transporter ATP-binding protein [Roseimicrobium gellanilyticum]RBP45312.1 ABC-type polysaccharide/polyol phosphate transport system ATPase subunit [Roseimicrobium gellanilyticum]
MSEPIIQVENLSKRYQIKHQSGERYTALRDVLARKVKNLFSSATSGHQNSTSEDFWALKDVSFQVNQGDVVGIIGRNGAGKSTLLKILSRITAPTEGRITLGGRVASLLEVGTGFHPELTGRENIFLNGAILGMTKAEIRSKFDEIVEFAAVEKFLDTPVKRYSSGMYVRLAFAVAAHLEPEILVVDEVLAVGDAQFQKKCLGRMSAVAQGGKTVLFVSHNMAAIQSLCTRAIYLDRGVIRQTGPIGDVLKVYMANIQNNGAGSSGDSMNLGPGLKIRDLTIAEGGVVSGEGTSFRIVLQVLRPMTIQQSALLIFCEAGTRVAMLDLRSVGVENLPVTEGTLAVEGSIATVPLIEGDYRVGMWLATDQYYGNYLDLTSFHVSGRSLSSDFIPLPASERGYVEMPFQAMLTQTGNP